ncbi:penicillin acylase family protein [Leptolyngbya sp. 'hensonii']|nr:penicillin acylase family protein [Leptolyngbya sp. 'hensonii']
MLLALMATTGATYIVGRSWPQTTGTIPIPGLLQPVTVLRDRWGVPHLYARNTHDLFLAQGYVQAQDRFWQMDFWRHAGAGRLSELFGQSQLATDQFLRTLGWARVAAQELQQLEPDTITNLQAYAAGVNAYLADHQGIALSLEYAFLKLLNPGYQPEPWQPVHTLTWGKVMAWDLGDNAAEEIERLTLLKTLTLAQVEELFPPYPATQPVILPGVSDHLRRSPERSEGESSQVLATIAPTLDFLGSQLQALQVHLGTITPGLGSNNWVISGKRTATGKPLLANDPHLDSQLPSIWHEIGLHCTPQGPDCPYNVTGFSFPGMFGVIIGHNDRIAWGVTNVGPDVQDLYIEKLNPQDPNQYEVNGQWVNMDLVSETIQVAGAAPVTQMVRYTRHGPIVSDTYKPLQEVDPRSLPQPYAIALHWTALEPAHLIQAIAKLDRARNWEEFRLALRDFDVPAQNFIYADVEGNIGYQMPGRMPIRAQGDGRYPVPGWTDAYEWKGTIPFEKLPFSLNPDRGYIATANNPATGPDYPYLITHDWDFGYRAERINQILESLSSPITLDDIRRMQGDNFNANAKTLVPVLLQVMPQGQEWAEIRSLLQGWNNQVDLNNAPATLFNVFWKHLLAATFHDELPEAYWPEGSDRWLEVVHNLIQQPQSPWWDDKATPAIEDRDQILRQALTDAIAELKQTLGPDSDRWRWGQLHKVTFRNQSLGKSGVAPIEALLNRGPYPVGGDSDAVNATHWNAVESYEVTALPSMRMIIDLANLGNSLAMHAPGQSGHAFHPHYADLVEPWRTIEYHPMLWERTAIETGDRLTLTPP